MTGHRPERLWTALADIEPFASMRAEAREDVASLFELLTVPRGTDLVHEGKVARALYIVISGRFGVFVSGQAGQVAEIGPGQPLGEIAFFGGGKRTATVRAQRDSVVMRLTRADFERLAERSPTLYPAVVKALAHRLAKTTAARDARAFAPPKTIAVCSAGPSGVATRARFVSELKSAFASAGLAVLFLDHKRVSLHLKADETFANLDEMGWFNALEDRYDHIVYVCDEDLNAWSEKALRQADHVVCIGAFDAAGGEPTPLERLVADLHEPRNIRLALVHKRRMPISGTRAWLLRRPWVGMHHHLSAGAADDMARLVRFVLGRARGLVACGGGAYTAAHIGMYKAVREAGHEIDIMGGTSGGAAMTAAFALDVPIEEIDRRLHDMFVQRKAMGRWTWPRYSLLDHSVFDAALAEHYSDVDIADLWMAYFAVATNLTRNRPVILREGPLWQAVRTSSAIPALLPPTITEDGELLVDGCLIENVPLQPMRDLKHGANIVLDLDPGNARRYAHRPDALPSRSDMVRQMLSRGGSGKLPEAPGPQAVLMKALMRERRDIAAELARGDILLTFPVPEAFGILDWTKHSELLAAGYAFAKAQLAQQVVA